MKKSSFDTVGFLKLAVPSYLMPFVFSGSSGFLLNKSDLIKASYSTIALPSLFATIISFILLWQLQKRQQFIFGRLVVTPVLVTLMILFSLLVIRVFRMDDFVWDILPSVGIGTAIVTLTTPLKKSSK